MGLKLPSRPIPYPPEDHNKVLTCAEVYCVEAFKKWRLIDREWVEQGPYCSWECKDWDEQIKRSMSDVQSRPCKNS